MIDIESYCKIYMTIASQIGLIRSIPGDETEKRHHKELSRRYSLKEAVQKN